MKTIDENINRLIIKHKWQINENNHYCPGHFMRQNQ